MRMQMYFRLSLVSASFFSAPETKAEKTGCSYRLQEEGLTYNSDMHAVQNRRTLGENLLFWSIIHVVFL